MSAPDSKQGLLSAGISAFSPWGSRSATPKPPGTPTQAVGERLQAADHIPSIEPQRGGDHTISRRHRLSLKRYPQDCPPLAVRWYHAVDQPKRKPFASNSIQFNKPLPKPKKWIPFSTEDSSAIETAFQKTADESEAAEQRKEVLSPTTLGSTQTGLQKSPDTCTKVPVNEDYLFDVEIETRELTPAYWLGPVYDVKRGTWFSPDGEPCDEHLATQLEEGYLKVRPWRFVKASEVRAASQPRTRPASLTAQAADDYRKELGRLNHRDSTSNPVTPKDSLGNLRERSVEDAEDSSSVSATPDPAGQENARSYRLFGTHMNSVVTYQDATTAYILTDDMWSRMGGTLYQRFTGAAHFAGAKYIRGWSDPAKRADGRSTKDNPLKPEEEQITTSTTKQEADASRLDASSGAEAKTEAAADTPRGSEDIARAASPSEARRKHLERQMSSLITSLEPGSSEKQEEEIRKRDEQEMREDYQDQVHGDQGREIEHLLLVTHGIGQRLGMRMESVNFILDVNLMRKSFKSVYANSTDLQALNSDVDRESKNSRIQVLPICWRHLLDFPQQSLKHNRREHDLGDVDNEDQNYPNLEDITVDGVPAVRNLLTDLALDILLYQSPAYKAHISRIVVKECNRIHQLFRERNPSFKGKVSLVGHSLGSAIMFDFLCQQRDPRAESANPSGRSRRATEDALKLDFEVEDFYALGSPIGLFQMLKGRTISARTSSASTPAETPASPLDDPFTQQAEKTRLQDVTMSSPLCKQLYNIFHPTDPISYRLEPLISPAMSTLKAQPLPYTKKGIFGAPAAQGLSGIGARVGQGVTDLWTSVSSGIASGLLNRSLGISGNDAIKMSSDLARSSRPLSIGAHLGGSAANNVTSGESKADDPARAFILEDRRRRLGEEPIAPGDEGEHPPTLIDSEIETLFAGFQKRRKSKSGDSEDADQDTDEHLEWQELEDRSRQLKKEEGKVRALNANGRVDYSIQEGAFDISLLASIASHLSYWADEDVSHFMISQLLARHRVFAKPR